MLTVSEVKQQVRMTADMVMMDYGDWDVPSYLSRFARNLRIVLYTDGGQTFNSLDAWATELRRLHDAGFRVHSCSSTNQNIGVLGDGRVAVFDHDVETVVSFEGKRLRLFEYETIIFELIDDSRWQVVYKHLSERAPAETID